MTDLGDLPNVALHQPRLKQGQNNWKTARPHLTPSPKKVDGRQDCTTALSFIFYFRRAFFLWLGNWASLLWVSLSFSIQFWVFLIISVHAKNSLQLFFSLPTMHFLSFSLLLFLSQNSFSPHLSLFTIQQHCFPARNLALQLSLPFCFLSIQHPSNIFSPSLAFLLFFPCVLQLSCVSCVEWATKPAYSDLTDVLILYLQDCLS